MRTVADELRKAVWIPGERCVPERYRTVSFDGYHHGSVIELAVKKALFTPSPRAGEILGAWLGRVGGDEEFIELPIWLSAEDEGEPVGVMSGEARIGELPAGSHYMERLAEVQRRDPTLVADGTIKARLDGSGVSFKKIRVHVYERPDAPG